MKRLLVIVSAVGLMLTMLAGPARAQGVSPEQLTKAGWDRLPGPSEQIPTTHCLPDAQAVLSGDATTSIVMTFGPEGEFWGTEFAIHHHLYDGQPCPQDEVIGGDGTYIDVSSTVGPYDVCHHFESPVT